MSIEKVLRAFAEDNFEEDSYYPVSHGQATLIKPLALVVKKPRSIYKRPFAKSNLVVIAVLDDYIEKEKKEEFTENKNSVILREENMEIGDDEEEEEEEEKEEDDTGTSSDVAVKLGAAKSIKVNVKIEDNLVELDLGKLDREYFNYPDLRELLLKTALDANRMKVLENQELRLIYSVIYSERFILKAKHKQKVAVEAEAKTLPEVAEVLKKYAQLKGKYKKKSITPKAATRLTRGPAFFKFVRVDYDKENGRLKLSEGEFVGPAVSSKERGTEADKTEYNESIVDMEDEERVSSEALGSYRGFFVEGNSRQQMTFDTGPLTDEDIKKLEIITEAVLLSEENREKRKERVKKYLNWFEEVLIKGQRKLSLDEPLTDEDCEFLGRIHCAFLSDRLIVDMSLHYTEKIQGYAIVLQQINDLSDEHWDEIEKAWAETELNN